MAYTYITSIVEDLSREVFSYVHEIEHGFKAEYEPMTREELLRDFAMYLLTQVDDAPQDVDTK